MPRRSPPLTRAQRSAAASAAYIRQELHAKDDLIAGLRRRLRQIANCSRTTHKCYLCRHCLHQVFDEEAGDEWDDEAH